MQWNRVLGASAAVAAAIACLAWPCTSSRAAGNYDSFAFTLERGEVRRTGRARGDSVAFEGAVALANDAQLFALDPLAQDFTVSVGSPYQEGLSVTIPAGSRGWKFADRRTWTWRSPRKSSPELSVRLDVAAERLSVAVRNFTFDVPPTNPVLVTASFGSVGAAFESAWRESGPGRLRYRAPRPVTVAVDGPPQRSSIASTGVERSFRVRVRRSGRYQIDVQAETLGTPTYLVLGPRNAARLQTYEAGYATSSYLELGPGDYLIPVTSLSSAGDFSVQVRSVADLAPDAPPVTGSVSPETPSRTYRVPVEGDGRYRLRARPAKDSKLAGVRLEVLQGYDPTSATSLAMLRPCAATRETGDEFVLLETNGYYSLEYFVRVDGDAPEARGAFTLELRSTTAAPATTDVVLDGAPAVATLSACATAPTFRLVIAERTRVVLTASSTATADVVALDVRGPDSDTETVVSDLWLPVTDRRYLDPGTYHLAVRASNLTADGDVAVTAATFVQQPLLVGGGPVLGAIDAAYDTATFAFTVSTAGSYTIFTGTLGLYDTTLRLLGPDTQSVEIAYNDEDPGPGFGNSRITADLAPGVYYAVVADYFGYSTGDFTIEVQKLNP